MSAIIPFWKYQAIGNDFPLFHASDLGDLDIARLAIRAADRKFGIGGDGILVMRQFDKGRAELRMFNPDGTEDFCGNGLRIAARHAYDQGWVGEAFTLDHRNREVPAQILPDGQISTQIGIADYAPKNVPIERETELFDGLIATIEGKNWKGSALTTGSTHTVIPVDVLPSDDEIVMLGPQFEYLSMFPDRTSVIFARGTGPMELEIRIWERGVGETLGCGTGSSAAAVDYLRRRSASGTVTVRNPGGKIEVSMRAWNEPITVIGTAQLAYSGRYLTSTH